MTFSCLPKTGLNLVEILAGLGELDDDPELQIQCDVFFEERLGDEEEWLASRPSGLDLDSHADVFNAILDKVVVSSVFIYSLIHVFLQFLVNVY